jgi:hypothetical protein
MVRTSKFLAGACAAVVLGLAAQQASAVIVFAPDNLGNNNVPGTVGDRIIRFDTANPLGTVATVGFAGAAAAGVGLGGMDFHANGNLYACDSFAQGGGVFTGSRLFTINQTNGLATLVGPLGLPATNAVADMSYNPVSGALQVVTNNAGTPQLHTVNVATGAATLVGNITGLPAGNLEIGLATNSAGVNFIHNLADDRMYQLAGLAATPMSATIGVDTNFSQGMTINWNGGNQWFLGSISNNPVFASQVRLMDNATGGTTSILGTWPNNGTGALPQYETGDLAIPIPEPTTLGAVAVVGLLGLRRRRD